MGHAHNRHCRPQTAVGQIFAYSRAHYVLVLFRSAIVLRATTLSHRLTQIVESLCPGRGGADGGQGGGAGARGRLTILLWSGCTA